MRVRKFAIHVAGAVLVSLGTTFAQASCVLAQSAELSALLSRVDRLQAEYRLREARVLAERAVEVARRTAGADSMAYAIALSRLSVNNGLEDRRMESERIDKEALAIVMRERGPDHPDTAEAISNLAVTYRELGRPKESIPLAERAVRILERAYGPDDPRLIPKLVHRVSSQSKDYADPDRLAKALGIVHRIVAIEIRTKGPESQDVLESMVMASDLQDDNAAGVAETRKILQQVLDVAQRRRYDLVVASSLFKLGSGYFNQGRTAEALEYMEQAVAAIEQSKRLRGSNPQAYALNYGQYLSNLGGVYSQAGRYRDAVAVKTRALKILEGAAGSDSTYVANTLIGLGIALAAQNRLAEARSSFERAITIYENTHGQRHHIAFTALWELAGTQRDQGDLQAAKDTIQRARELSDSLQSTGADLGSVITRHASIEVAAERHRPALSLYNEGIALFDRDNGRDHVVTASARSQRALVHCALGDHDAALADAREAAAFFQKRITARGSRSPGGRDYFGVDAFPALACATLGVASKAGANRDALASEAFVGAAYEEQSAAAAAINQMAVRTTGDDRLAKAARKQQDLAMQWQGLDLQLTNALSTADTKRDQSGIDRLRRERAETERLSAAAMSELQRDFPEFAALTSPQPMTIAEVQRLLKPDEALVAFLLGRDASFVWAVTTQSWDWQQIPTGKRQLTEMIAALRRPLDLGTDDFNLAQAYQLYRNLLGPVEKTLQGKRHLLIVPTGPLTALPFNTLVTVQPTDGPANAELFQKAAWLVRRHAITIVPGAATLRALRAISKPSNAGKPFLGFGNPVFASAPPPATAKQRSKRDEQAAKLAKRATSKPRGVSDFFVGRSVNADALRALTPLPDTADELKAIASSLAASPTDVILAGDASETTLKRLNADGRLADYRVVAFATHGLIAGDIEGLAEPAIALTVPAKASATDDGLLMASEAAQLRMNASWIILSACNTAAGGEPGAPALSGLSRAFFYAGARALLVSHWKVFSEAAVSLTTQTFASLEKTPGIGRAEAFRQSMLALLDSGDHRKASPIYWAPYFVVGEGGVD